MARHYGISSSVDNLTNEEVSGYSFLPQIQRTVLEDRPKASGPGDHDKEDTWEGELRNKQ